MCAKRNKQEAIREIRNSKAYHTYHVEDKYEAGVVFTGTEIKSVRAGKAQITEAFVRIERGEAILYHSHIDEYAFGNIHNHNPTRPRKLLLHKREIDKLKAASQAEGYAIIPLRIYFKKALAKVEIALCKGKKLHDKRETLRKKTELREAERFIKDQRR